MILIMGMPGAGKSVQGGLISERLGFHRTSTGDIIRGTKDPEVRGVMERGELVNDELMSRLLADKLKEIGYDSTFLLDGFPRTVDQAKWLLGHGEEIGKHVKLVLYLVVSDEVAIKRLGDRGRVDDDEETQKQRRKEAEKIIPTLEYLAEKDVTIEEINADGTVEEIFELIKQAVEKHV